MNKSSFITSILLLIASVASYAQGSGTEMADAMRANGKIYIVVLVLATIFAGIILYLIRIDGKITKMEEKS